MLRIQPATDEQLPAFADLLYRSAVAFITPEFSDEAAQRFLQNENVEKLRSIVQGGGYYAGAWWQDQLAGFVGVRAPTHIVHLFVEQRFHHCAIGKALLAYALASIRLHTNSAIITVNSSNYALNFYSRAGFVCSDALQCKDGVFYTPMQINLSTL